MTDRPLHVVLCADFRDRNMVRDARRGLVPAHWRYFTRMDVKDGDLAGCVIESWESTPTERLLDDQAGEDETDSVRAEMHQAVLRSATAVQDWHQANDVVAAEIVDDEPQGTSRHLGPQLITLRVPDGVVIDGPRIVLPGHRVWVPTEWLVDGPTPAVPDEPDPRRDLLAFYGDQVQPAVVPAMVHGGWSWPRHGAASERLTLTWPEVWEQARSNGIRLFVPDFTAGTLTEVL